MTYSERRVMFTTGIRSEYDILYSVMDALKRTAGAIPQLIVTGAHLTELHGGTKAEIEADGFEIVARIESLAADDTPAGRAKSVAKQLRGLVDTLASARPDITVAMGDREEALTVAVAATFLEIPVSHIGGGDWAGAQMVDNRIRDAVSKLAHLHFVTSERSAQRLREMGEEAWRIHVTGAPGVDRLLAIEPLPLAELSRRLDFDLTRAPYAVVIQHAVTGEEHRAGEQMRTTLRALQSLPFSAVVIYPNSDPGSQQIINAIEQATTAAPRMVARRNLPREEFASLLRHAAVLVGNSSCGIIEAPALQLPVVNIGDRQAGREHGDNVLFVEHSEDDIREAISRAIQDESFRAIVRTGWNPYGDGNAGRRIAAILASAPLDARLLSKSHAGPD